MIAPLLLAAAVALTSECVVVKDPALLDRISAKDGRGPQVILQGVVDGFLDGQARNEYNAMLLQLREACRTGKWTDALACEAVMRKRP